jgi:hypothetical protein
MSPSALRLTVCGTDSRPETRGRSLRTLSTEPDSTSGRSVYTVYLAAVGRKARRSDHLEFSNVSERVASSDRKKLVDADLLDAVGEKRGRHYIAHASVRNMRDAVRQPRASIIDPFLR